MPKLYHVVKDVDDSILKSLFILDCVDCEIGWGDWSECIDGERKRYERITVQPVGAGEGCPFLQTETEPCVHCEVEWEDWGECEDGLRTRKQYEAVQAVGPGGILCLPLQTENESKFYGF